MRIQAQRIAAQPDVHGQWARKTSCRVKDSACNPSGNAGQPQSQKRETHPGNRNTPEGSGSRLEVFRPGQHGILRLKTDSFQINSGRRICCSPTVRSAPCKYHRTINKAGHGYSCRHCRARTKFVQIQRAEVRSRCDRKGDLITPLRVVLRFSICSRRTGRARYPGRG